MKSVFWASVALLFYTFAGYPLLMFALSRLRRHTVKRRHIEPSVSIVIAAHNEADILGAKLASLARLDYPADRIEIIIASDGSTDATDELIRSVRDPRVRLITCKKLGKAAALNAGVAAASREIVCFTDARQMLEPEALRCLVTNFADPSVGCVSGELMLKDTNSSNVGVGLYWKIEKLVRVAESCTGSAVGATGAFYAVRRALIPQLPLGTILDDVFVPLEVVRQRKRVLFESGARAWDTLPAKATDEFRRKVRTLAGNYQLVQMSPWLLVPSNPIWFRFVSHKLLRLGAPVLLVATFISSWFLAGGNLLYAGAAIVQSALALMAILGLCKLWPESRLCSAISGFYLLNAAAAVACVMFVRHRNRPQQMWTNAPQPGHAKARASGGA